MVFAGGPALRVSSQAHGPMAPSPSVESASPPTSPPLAAQPSPPGAASYCGMPSPWPETPYVFVVAVPMGGTEGQPSGMYGVGADSWASWGGQLLEISLPI